MTLTEDLRGIVRDRPEQVVFVVGAGVAIGALGGAYADYPESVLLASEITVGHDARAKRNKPRSRGAESWCI